MVDETEDISKLNEIPSLKTSDSTIIANMTFQLGFAAIAIILFIPIRRKLLWLYSPNTKNKKQHPAYNLSKNYVSWMWPVISTSDVQLLNVIGLDSFMMLQTLKLMYRIFFILALMLVPLMFLYYSGDQARYDQYFLKFTIQNVARKNFYLPLIYVYINTFVIFYLIFIYYKKHVSIRQAYIRAPSILTSLTSLKRLSFGHKNYLKLIDIKAKSVFMLRIPPFVDTDRELRIFVEALGVGAVEHCALVQDTRKIDSLTSKRDYIARDIEGEIEKAWRMILLEIEKQSKDKENMKEIYTRIKKLEQKHKSEEMAHGDLPKKPEDKDGDDQATQAEESKEPEGKDGDDQPDEDKENDDNGENDQADENKENDDKSGDDQADEDKEPEDKGENDQADENKENDDKYSYEQSTQGDGSKGGLSKEKTNKDAHRFLYSKNRYIKRYGKTDALTYKMAQLEKIQKKMVDETARRLKKSVEEKPSDQIIELMNKNNLMYTRVDIANDVSFFSLYQIFYLRKHWHNFTLDLPTNARSAFVTFVNPKSAQILPQCLISSRVFTCKAIPAPVPQDVIWENINRGEVEIYFKKLLGKLIFLLFNSAFYTLVLGVINLIELENLEYYFPSIKVLTDIEVVRSSFDGIITPLIFNALLTIAPIVLTLLTYYEGVYSYSGLYISLTDRFGHFLIFNGFLSFLCSSTFVGMARDFLNKQASFSKFTNEFGNNLIKLSLFFTNTIIQRIVVGNLFAVLKPAKLVLEIFSDKILVMFGSVRSHRSKIEIKLPDNANFGVLYPTLIIVFPIGLTYSVISPLMAILAGFYFFVTYLTYKEEFLYALCNEFESGGTYWDVVSNQMVTSLFIFQAAMICQFIVGHAKFEATLITPLIIVTYMYKDSLKTMFNKSTMFYPLNAQEETYVDDFTEKLIAERKNMVEHWHEELDPTDPNIIKCDDILDKIESERIVDYPYRGSVEGVDCIMFPNKFFEKLEIIKEYDPDDDLGLFSEMKQEPKE